MTKTDALFTELKKHITETVNRTRWWKTLIIEESWTLIDKRAAVHRCHGIESRAQSHIFTQLITNLIKRDRQKCTTEFGITIEAMLIGHNLQGA
jgi:hypothetical protein